MARTPLRRRKSGAAHEADPCCQVSARPGQHLKFGSFFEALGRLVEGRVVECQPLDRDTYGRIIASCSADGVDLAGALVDAGLAWAFVRYSGD